MNAEAQPPPRPQIAASASPNSRTPGCSENPSWPAHSGPFTNGAVRVLCAGGATLTVADDDQPSGITPPPRVHLAVSGVAALALGRFWRWLPLFAIAFRRVPWLRPVSSWHTRSCECRNARGVGLTRMVAIDNLYARPIRLRELDLLSRWKDRDASSNNQPGLGSDILPGSGVARPRVPAHLSLKRRKPAVSSGYGFHDRSSWRAYGRKLSRRLVHVPVHGACRRPITGGSRAGVRGLLSTAGSSAVRPIRNPS